jgi:hypothetical protein
MPRARTQSGIATCAATASELATEIHAMPNTTITGTATQNSPTPTTSAEPAA